MRTVFDENLDELHRDILEMGVLVNRAIDNATRAFINHDLELAEEVVEGDLRINKKEMEVDTKSQQLIAMQQPIAHDLRRIISVMKASSNFERMADHARNIAEATRNIEGHKRDEASEELVMDMAKKVMTMTEGILDAFLNFDVDRAVEIAKRDAEVDALYVKLRLVVIDSMKEDPATVSAASSYSFIGMDFERIGDYVKNIAEALVYQKTGEIVDLN